MRPLSIQARNYGVFADLDLDLPLGASAVTGPNGAGKTTLIEAVDRALFGARDMREWVSAGEEEMFLQLEFEHAGTTYKVRRGYSARGRGKATLDLEEGDAPLTRESMKETQAELERILGFSQTTFRASAFLMQGGAGSFTDPGLDARHRKEMLAELLGLEVYERYLERVRLRMAGVRDATSRLAIRVEEAERELAGHDDAKSRVGLYERDVADSTARLETAEDTHRTATEKLTASREVAAKLAAAREVLASRERELATAAHRHQTLSESLRAADELPKLKAEAETLAGRRESIESDLAAAREGEKAREELRRLTVERDRLTGEANALREKEAALLGKATELEQAAAVSAERCDRCDQRLTGDARGHAVKSMKTEALGYHTQAKDLESKADALGREAWLDLEQKAAAGPNAAKQAELEAALRIANEADRTLASIAEREKVIEEQALEYAQLEIRLPELKTATNIAKRDVDELTAQAPGEDLEAAVARAYGVLVEARSDVEGAKGRLVVAQAELQRLNGLEALAAENRRALDQHQADLDLLTDAERLYGKNGLPAYVLENRAIPLMEAKANDYLSRLGGKTRSARVELRTQREKRSGDGLVEALDIVICTAEGVERGYPYWSGGERMRIDIALRLALLALSGAEMGILILDEPGDLDESGKGDLIDLLNSLLALGVERVLLVSHDPDLRDAFDNSIEVAIAEDGRSLIVEAAEREEVPA